MMKKTIQKTSVIALILLLVMILTGCGFDASVEDLLTAPPLNSEQQAVLSALEVQYSDRLNFVYPLTGPNRSAIQRVDLDSDGMNEVLVFFQDPGEGINAMVSVLEQEEVGYSYTASAVGLGDGVNSFNYVRTAPDSHVLLVEWTSPNKSSNTVSVYYYTGESLEVGFEENCNNLKVVDFNQDNVSEFCYTTPASIDTGFSLKYVVATEDSRLSRFQYNLDASINDVRNMQIGSLRSGGLALIVDEEIEDGLQSEVFTYDNDHRLVPLSVEEGLDLVKISKRPLSDGLFSRTISDVMCIPSSSQPVQDVFSPSDWVYWYSVDNQAIALEMASYVDLSSNYIFPIPVSWLSDAYIDWSEDLQEDLVIRKTDSEEEYASLIILGIDDNSLDAVSKGFSLLGSDGAYRYFVRLNGTEEEKAFIRGHFISY